MDGDHDVERWARELREAGWWQERLHVWRSPSGNIYRGPYGAWCQMLKRNEYDSRPPQLIPIPDGTNPDD